MKPGALWPAAVVGALTVTVAANVAMFVLANGGNRAVVEPRYYERAVAWDSTMAEIARSEATGWTATAVLAPGADRARDPRLTVRLADRAGRGLEGATVRVEAIHNLDSERGVHATLLARGNGVYATDLPLRHRGLWELRVTASRGGERFRADLRRDLPPGEDHGRHGAP
jgi:nitrogen fixation protein FixH